MKRVTRLRMLFAASAVALFAFLSPVHALLLNGNYLRVGVNGGGSLFDSATSNSVRFDPTGTGTFGAADFFYPGSPVEGWTIKIDGTVYAQTSPSVGIVGTLTDTSAGTTLRAHYLSNPIAATGIRVEQVIAFDIAGQVIRFDVYVTNTSSVARTVKYMRYGDPDQGANVGAGYNTLNDVQLVPQGKLVTAETTSHGTVGFGALGLSDAVAFQVVAFETGVTGSTNDPDVVLSAPNDPNGASGDDTVHVAFDVGSIAPGATKSFSHYTVFGPTALDVVALFNDLDATPAGPAALVTLSGAASFLNPDAPRTLIASITDAAGHRLREDNSTVVTFEQLNALDEGAGTVNGLGPVTVVEGRATLTITGGALGPVVIGASADGLAPGFGNPVSFSVSPTVPLPYALRDGLSWDWTIQQDGEVEGTDSAFSWGFWLQTNGYGFPNRTTALASLAGRQVEIGPQVITASEAGDGLEITRKVYVSPTDGFIRYLEIYNNTWTSDIEATAYIRSYSGGEGTSTVRTSSGDNLFDTEDNWIAQHDFYYPATAVVTAGDGGAIRPSYAEYYGDYRIQYQYDFTVPAGQQRIIMHFGAQRSSVDAAEAAAISLANLTPPDALVDMSDAERNAVINWSINATSGPATQIALYGGTATLRPEASRTFTAIIQDADGLRVVGDNTTPITFTRSDASGTTALGTVTAVAGRAQFTMLGGAEGEVTIQASGGVPLAAGPGNPVSFLVFSIVNISDGLTLEDSQGFQWDIQSDGDISDGTSDAFDGGLYLTTDTSGTRSFDWFPGQSTGRMEAAGRQLVLGPALMGGEVSPAVEVTRRIYIPRASAFARFFEDIHNPNEEPVTVTIKIESNLGSDGDETFLETSSGDDIFDADDNWYVSDDPYGPPPEGDPAVAFVIAGDGGLIRPSAASRDYDDIIYEYVVDIPAGETVSILHYSAQRNSGDEGVSIAMELEALLGDALGGMTPEQLARVQNFPTSPTSPYAIAKLSGDGASAPVGSAHPFIARVQNYFGDPVEGAEVAFAVIEGGGTLAESSAISNADGEVVANLTLGATPGLNRVQMSVGSHVATFSVTGTRIIPVLSSISPVHVVAGASSVTLTLSGDKFNADAVVQWNGSDRPTTWVSITELTAEIPSTDLATAAEANVTVVNPGVAGDTSVIKKFRVRHPLIVVSNSGTVPLTVNQIAYDAKLYDILPHASFGVPAGGVQGIAIDFATIPIGSASDPIRVPITVTNLGADAVDVGASTSVFTMFPTSFTVDPGAARTVQVLFPPVDVLGSMSGDENLGIMLANTAGGTTPVLVDVSVGAITQAPLPISVISVYPHQFRQIDLDGGPVTVAVELADVFQAESVTQVELSSGTSAFTLPVAHEPGGSSVTFAVSGEDVAGIYGRYRLSVVPYGAGGVGVPVPTDSALYIGALVEEAWLAKLTLTTGSGSASVDFGSALNTSDAFVTGEDSPQPPPSPAAPYMTLRLGETALRRDIRAVPETGRMAWNLEVTVPASESGLLAWSGLDAILPYYDNAFIEQAGKAMDLRTHASMTLAPGTYISLLVVEQARPKELIATLSSGAIGWSMFSIPGEASVGSPEALGTYDVSTVYGWDDASQMYVPMRGAELVSPITEGYFIHRDAALGAREILVMVNVDAPSARATEVTMYPGWNLIGVPYGGAPVSVFGVGVDEIYEWTTDGYIPVPLTATLEPFKSYWMYNHDATPRTVLVVQPRHRGTIAGNVLDDPGTIPTAPQTMVKPTWSTSLTLVDASGKEYRVTVGANATSKSGYDMTDAPMPPAPPVRDVAEFFATTPDGSGPRLSRDYEPIVDRQGQWTLKAVLPAPATIRWDGLTLAPGYRLVLDVGDVGYNLLTKGETQLPAGSHELRVRFHWSAPSMTRALVNFPNPFNPETWIPFELTDGSDVRISIFDVAGSNVRTLDLGYRDAGYYTSRGEAAYWDGRNELGERVASGVYIYEFRAGTYRTVRRMLILK